jgi:hypothetical protein
MGELNKQKSILADEKRQLEAKVSSLEQENSTLQSSLASKSSAPAPSSAPSSAPASVSSEETRKLNALIVSNLIILRNHQTNDMLSRQAYVQNAIHYLLKRNPGTNPLTLHQLRQNRLLLLVNGKLRRLSFSKHATKRLRRSRYD